MRRKYSRLLTFIIAFSMILSMHVSFANGPNEDLEDPYVLLAKFEMSGSSWVEDGPNNGVTITSGSAIEVSFTSDEPVYAVLIKGGTDTHVVDFNGVYSGSFNNSELELPNDNNPGSPGLSNIKFYTIHFGELEIEKIVTDEDDSLLPGDDTVFKFMIEILEEWDENLDLWDDIDGSEHTITGNDSITIDNLPLGKYRITEIEIDSDYYLDTSNGIDVELITKDEGDSVSFTNIKKDTPLTPVGEIIISKTLLDQQEQPITDDDTEFEFMIEIYDDELDIWNEIQGSPVFLAGGESETLEDLPLGQYRVTEVGPPTGYTRLSDETVDADLLENGDSKDADFTNMRDEVIPPRGSLQIIKIVTDEDGSVLEGDETDFTFRIEYQGEGWMTISGSPFTIEGNGSETINNLPLGQYRVTEINIDSDYYLDSDNLQVVSIETNGDEEIVSFTNVLEEDTPPPPPDDDDDEEEDEEEEEEVLTITTDPIPQSPIVIETVQPEPEPEMEVIEEPVPQATLPRTGASDPTVFAGFGAAFMALGLFLKKKRF